MSDGFKAMVALQRDMIESAQAQLTMHKHAITATEQALAAHKLVNTHATTGLKMWHDWLDLWMPRR